MKRVSLSLLSLIIAVVMSGFVSAQDTTMAGAAKTKKTTASKSTAAKRTNFSGTVTAVSATSITAKTAKKGDLTAGINEKTKIKDGAGQPKTAGDIKNGDKVRVYASADGSGAWRATSITINPVKAASKAKKTGTK